MATTPKQEQPPLAEAAVNEKEEGKRPQDASSHGVGGSAGASAKPSVSSGNEPSQSARNEAMSPASNLGNQQQQNIPGFTTTMASTSTTSIATAPGPTTMSVPTRVAGERRPSPRPSPQDADRRRRMTLMGPEEVHPLANIDTVACRNLQVFEVTSPARGIELGQVGLECVYCASEARAFPLSWTDLAHAVRRLGTTHLRTCKRAPNHVRDAFARSPPPHPPMDPLIDYCIHFCRTVQIRQTPYHRLMWDTAVGASEPPPGPYGASPEQQPPPPRGVSVASIPRGPPLQPTMSQPGGGGRGVPPPPHMAHAAHYGSYQTPGGGPPPPHAARRQMPPPLGFTAGGEIASTPLARRGPPRAAAPGAYPGSYPPPPYETPTTPQMIHRRIATDATSTPTRGPPLSRPTPPSYHHPPHGSPTSSEVGGAVPQQQPPPPPAFPFYQDYTTGHWICKYCSHVPPQYRDPGSIWTEPSSSPPPPGFIDHHLSMCRGYHSPPPPQPPGAPPGYYSSQPPPHYATYGHPPPISHHATSYGGPPPWTAAGYGAPPPHSSMSPHDYPGYPSGSDPMGHAAHHHHRPPPPSHLEATTAPPVLKAPPTPGDLGRSSLASTGRLGVATGVGGGLAIAPSTTAASGMADSAAAAAGASRQQSDESNTPLIQNAIRHLMDYHQKLQQEEMAASAAERGDSSFSGHHHQQQQQEDHQLVLGEDKLLLTEYFFHLMRQLRVCRFSENDRKTRGGKRENISIGYGGLQCVHCSSAPNARKFFWSNVDRLANSFAEIPSHVLKCRRCPQSVKQALSDLKTIHSAQMSKLPRGSQKVFFRRMWRRLHEEDPHGAQGPGLTKAHLASKKMEREASVVASGYVPTTPSDGHEDETTVSPGTISDTSGGTANLIERSTSEAAKALAASAQLAPGDGTASTSSPGMGGSSRILLAISEDKEWLSDMDCFVRRQLEVFCASEQDVALAEADRKYPIRVGQVGIRCIHCAMAAGNSRTRGAAVQFPFSICGIYESVREFQRVHLESCPNLPRAIKSKLMGFQGSASLSSVLRRYYVLSAKALGMYDTNNGISAGGKVEPVGGSATAFAFADKEEEGPSSVDRKPSPTSMAYATSASASSSTTPRGATPRGPDTGGYGPSPSDPSEPPPAREGREASFMETIPAMTPLERRKRKTLEQESFHQGGGADPGSGSSSKRSRGTTDEEEDDPSVHTSEEATNVSAV